MTSLSHAFALQAQSDLDAYEALCRIALPTCHRLHYLQMWLEKLCKAYLWLPESEAVDLRGRHNVVEKVLPQLIREHWRRIGFDGRPDIGAIRAICREVDLLHPQVNDGGRRPDNVEYPWVSAQNGDALIPARQPFALAQRVHGHSGRLLLKAAQLLTRNPAGIAA
ncbi:MAG: hypothetical protein IT348_02400 [Candidatus Eisenbacteria bacterium]|nr:hypothetical protein [Candidatus Eisenbacteria bacterium]